MIEIPTPFDDTDRGQVGIGTLIVFIAMVLVAAIAAGVLINTADLLQTQAQETGEQTTAQTTNQLDVQTVVGENTSDSNNINTINMTVSLGPGSDPINLSEARLLYTDGTMSYEEDITDAGEEVTVDPETLSSEEDTSELQINLTQSPIDASLGAGEDAEIVLTTAEGAQTETQVTVPDPLEDDVVRFE